MTWWRKQQQGNNIFPLWFVVGKNLWTYDRVYCIMCMYPCRYRQINERKKSVKNIFKYLRSHFYNKGCFLTRWFLYCDWTFIQKFIQTGTTTFKKIVETINMIIFLLQYPVCIIDRQNGATAVHGKNTSKWMQLNWFVWIHRPVINIFHPSMEIAKHIFIRNMMYIRKLGCNTPRPLQVQVINLYNQIHSSKRSCLRKGFIPKNWELFLLHTIEWEKNGRLNLDPVCWSHQKNEIG